MIEEYLITKDIFFEKICYYYLIEFFFILSRMTVISALKVPLVARKNILYFIGEMTPSVKFLSDSFGSKLRDVISRKNF